MDVQRARIAEPVGAPYLVKQFSAGDNLANMMEQQAEEFKFFVTQREFLIVFERAAGV